ncbi:MAG: hypothetical protein H6510_05420 [Acidobacteria bacterium]|nr:hypothetical protein [Acidobacteriota bacterium]MCB9397233.1 hypothetical protein [Acidobacteriota bacterium]
MSLFLPKLRWLAPVLISFCVFAQTTTAKASATPLPLPSSLPLQDYEQVLYRFLMERQYVLMGWDHDKEVRDTGPYIENQYFGTHPAVRIYYSPEVISWLKNDRKGEIPDGAMIIKEMFTPPAVLYQDLANDPKYADPAAYQKLINQLISAWTVIVRDRQASKDGWFWANPGAPGQGESIEKAIQRQLDTLTQPPNSSFGAPCLRCHASAENQFTFSALRNIQGFMPDQEPLRFLVDTSWRSAAHFKDWPLSQIADEPYVKAHFMLPDLLRPYSSSNPLGAEKDADFHTGLTRLLAAHRTVDDEALPKPNPAILKAYGMNPEPENKVQTFPSQWNDQVLPAHDGAEAFITSDNCLGCHGGLGGEPYGVTMFVSTGPNYGDGYNLSEYGEWRWSPMGLAGRDPIFFAQIESEMVYLQRDAKRNPTPLVGSLEDNMQAVVNTCTSCHGAMGQRQLAIDAESNPHLDPNFKIDYMFLAPRISSKQPEPPDHEAMYVKYGQLGREGVSCAICHHIDKPSPDQIENWNPPPGYLTGDTNKELAFVLFHNNTGRFEQGPNDQFFGPFADVRVKPMDNTLGVTPTENAFIRNSQLCGACHSINLPNIGATDDRFPVLNAAETNPAFQSYQHSIEQATFLEWQNSAFAQDPGQPNSQFQSCQDCHMPRDFKTPDGQVNLDNLTTQIAAIQDANFPEAENRLPIEDIDVPLRPDYRRHEHVGLNVFLLEMFDQFPQILGVDKSDYMTSATNGVDTAVNNMIIQAQAETADITTQITQFDGTSLSATVTVTNKTGHRYPSGVAFRRAFIEFSVLDGEKVIWCSGRTNGAGILIDNKGNPLPTEFLPNGTTYQPHYQVITQEDQVQIYEELNQDMDREFTTSFIHRVYDIKDNRLLPRGWRAADYFKPQGQVLFQFMEATDPVATGNDPDYMDQGPGFKGQDSLKYEVKLPYKVDKNRLKVRATLYNQSIPPYWIHQRLQAAPTGQATQRLFYMISHLDLKGTPMADWKLKLVHAEAHARDK